MKNLKKSVLMLCIFSLLFVVGVLVEGKDLKIDINNAQQEISSGVMIKTKNLDGATLGSNNNKLTIKIASGLVLISSGEDKNIVQSSRYASILGGKNNEISTGGDYSTILGGVENVLKAAYSFIGGGVSNVVNSVYSVIMGGNNNEIEGGIGSIILGGSYNSLNGSNSVVIGNKFKLQGDNSVGLGVGSDTGDPDLVANNSFLWKDDSSTEKLTTDNVFAIISQNGMVINTGLAYSGTKLNVRGSLIITTGAKDENVVCGGGNGTGIIKLIDKESSDQKCLCSCDGYSWNSLLGKGQCNFICEGGNLTQTKAQCKTDRGAVSMITGDNNKKNYLGSCTSGTVISGSYYVKSDYKDPDKYIRQSHIYWACQEKNGDVAMCDYVVKCGGEVPNNAVANNTLIPTLEQYNNDAPEYHHDRDKSKLCSYSCREGYHRNGIQCIEVCDILGTGCNAGGTKRIEYNETYLTGYEYYCEISEGGETYTYTCHPSCEENYVWDGTKCVNKDKACDVDKEYDCKLGWPTETGDVRYGECAFTWDCEDTGGNLIKSCSLDKPTLNKDVYFSLNKRNGFQYFRFYIEDSLPITINTKAYNLTHTIRYPSLESPEETAYDYVTLNPVFTDTNGDTADICGDKNLYHLEMKNDINECPPSDNCTMIGVCGTEGQEVSDLGGSLNGSVATYSWKCGRHECNASCGVEAAGCTAMPSQGATSCTPANDSDCTPFGNLPLDVDDFYVSVVNTNIISSNDCGVIKQHCVKIGNTMNCSEANSACTTLNGFKCQDGYQKEGCECKSTSCAATTYTSGNCEYKIPVLSSGASITTGTITQYHTGTIKATCSNGVLSYSDWICEYEPQGCPAREYNTGHCSFSIEAGANGETKRFYNNKPGYTGNIRVMCNDGTRLYMEQSCEEIAEPTYHCDKGRYLPANSTGCSKCPCGYYCPGGYFSEGSLTQGKIECEGGTWASTGAFVCATCSTGQVPNSTQCGCETTPPTTYSCAAGRYLPAYSTTCSQCPCGYYCEGGDFSQRTYDQGKTNCESGWYSNEGTNSCTKCASGYHSTTDLCGCIKDDDPIYTCAAGRYLPANSTECSKCPCGYYCEGGTWSKSSNDQGKKGCGAGKYSNAGATSISSCSNISCGYYGSGACSTAPNGQKCESGWYSNEGTNSCTKCASGYHSTTDLCGCIKDDDPTYTCDAGRYLPANSTGCSKCPCGYYCEGGTWSKSSNDQGKKECGAGKWSITGATSVSSCGKINCGYHGTNACSATPNGQKCGTGTYSNVGASSCSNCPLGQQPNSTQCECIDIKYTCAAGRYLPKNETTCSKCPCGHYCEGGTWSKSSEDQGKKECGESYYSSTGSSSCNSCASGQQPNNGQCGCIDTTYSCDAGRYLPANSTECSKCPCGYYCTGGSFTKKSYDQGKKGCGAGKWSEAGATSISSCSNISCGYYGSGACSTAPNGQKCGSGWYSNEGANSCTKCASGYHSTTDLCGCIKDDDPTYTCDAGRYLPANSTGCSKCPCGYYCEGGTWSKSSNDQGKKECGAGKWSITGATSVSSCGKINCGYYGNSECSAKPNGKKCASDKYSSTGASECSTSPLGWHPNSTQCGLEGNIYNIQYVLGGGSHGSSHPITGRYYSGITISNPSKTGYRFTGWKITNMGVAGVEHKYGNKTTTDATIESTTATAFENLHSTNGATVTFTAQWDEKTAILTYNANSCGTAPDPATMTFSAEAYAAYTMKTINTGWTLSGWNTKADGSGTGYNKGGKIKSANTNPSSMTLYAQCIPPTAILTYNANGCGTAPDSEIMIYGEATYAADAMKVINQGWTLSGWNTEPGGNGTGYNKGGKIRSASTNPTAMTLFAQCIPPTATLTYYANDCGIAPNSVTMTFSDPTYATGMKSISEGKTFQNWNTKQDGSGTGYNKGDRVKAAGTNPITMRLYAQCTLNEYKISYNLNGGTHGSSHPTKATYNEEFTVNNPTKNGFIFTGWNITGMDNVKHYYGYYSGTAQTLLNIKETKFKNLRSTSGIVTFSAQWNETTAKLTYSGNDCGTPTRSTVTMTYTAETKADSMSATNGRTFTKWCTQKNGGGNCYTANQTVKEANKTPSTMTLYAQCTAKLTYSGNSCGTPTRSTVTMTYTGETKADSMSATNGRTFTKWCIQSNGNGTCYTANQTVKEANKTPTAMTLYAQCTAEPTATLTYSGNNCGTPTRSTVTMTYTAETKADSMTATNGRTFTKWCTQSNGNGTCYTANQTVKEANKTPTAMTLYAQCTINGCAATTKSDYSIPSLTNNESKTVYKLKSSSKERCSATATCSAGTVTLSSDTCKNICASTTTPLCNSNTPWSIDSSTGAARGTTFNFICKHISRSPSTVTCYGTCPGDYVRNGGSCVEQSNLCDIHNYSFGNPNKGCNTSFKENEGKITDASNSSITAGYSWRCKNGRKSETCTICNSGYDLQSDGTCKSISPVCNYSNKSNLRQNQKWCDVGEPVGGNDGPEYLTNNSGVPYREYYCEAGGTVVHCSNKQTNYVQIYGPEWKFVNGRYVLKDSLSVSSIPDSIRGVIYIWNKCGSEAGPNKIIGTDIVDGVGGQPSRSEFGDSLQINKWDHGSSIRFGNIQGAYSEGPKYLVVPDNSDQVGGTKDIALIIKNDCGGSPSCFVAGTKVTMADRTQKNIEDVEVGEKVLGANGAVNTVLGFHRPLLGQKKLWSINGGEYFVTAEHPFMTTDGWKSLNPELTKIGMENLSVGLLELGDTLITENGNIKIYSLNSWKSLEDTQLYNFKLDGDHTYYANGYLVHNKGGGGAGCRCNNGNCSEYGGATCTKQSAGGNKYNCIADFGTSVYDCQKPSEDTGGSGGSGSGGGSGGDGNLVICGYSAEAGTRKKLPYVYGGTISSSEWCIANGPVCTINIDSCSPGPSRGPDMYGYDYNDECCCNYDGFSCI